VFGVAVKEEITGAGIVCAVTVTPTLAVAVPAGPVAVRRYEVLSVGVTVVEPDGASEPLTPVIVTDVAFCVVHVRVTGCPAETVVADAEKFVTTGLLLGEPLGLFESFELPPHEASPTITAAPQASAANAFHPLIQPILNPKSLREYLFG
jgi:hypothetical protein